ncbi:serine/threonine-protein kinase [Nonomuraea typhae]|uniref:serine/threonine-protein kinase n=1 Tax=Nonomuraea typhae TaxID=2603600 RepID=UPI0012F71A0D|nr:serine/threonine-protein kinase [Nonomuraea typhae]
MSEQLGPYRLLSRLGSGGFGEVHLALDQEGRTVAVKILHPHVAADGAALTRLAREVETMRRVRGPHVAEVLDASLEVERPYLVTRYVQGRPLSAVPVPVADLRLLARGLAGALSAMHEAGVIHRDLKPANVMMADGEPVVIDFGIACALDSLSVTASGAVIGTPGYLAPEVLEGRDAGMEADVFSFGATLAYAATGRQPYGKGPASAVAYRVVHHEPDLDGVPEWLAPLLRECLAQDPAARPTAARLCKELGATTSSQARHAPSARTAFSGTAQPPAFVPGRNADLQSVTRADPHAEPTREWQPGGRRTPEVERARHREKVRRRWLIGAGLFISLLAAAAQDGLPQVSLFLLSAFTLGSLADAGVALFSRSPFKNRRMVADLAAIAGTGALWWAMSTFFSPFTLTLFAVTALVVGVVVLMSA